MLKTYSTAFYTDIGTYGGRVPGTDVDDLNLAFTIAGRYVATYGRDYGVVRFEGGKAVRIWPVGQVTES